MGEKGKREDSSSRHSSSGTRRRLHRPWDGRTLHGAVPEMMHAQRRLPRLALRARERELASRL